MSHVKLQPGERGYVKLQSGERGYVKLQSGERGCVKLESTQEPDEPHFIRQHVVYTFRPAEF